MSYPKIKQPGFSCNRPAAALLAGISLLIFSANGQTTKPKTAPPARPAAPAAHRSAGPAAGSHSPAGNATHPNSAAGGNKGAAPIKAPPGGTVHQTAKGTVAKDARGNTTAFKGANGHEATFSSNGKVKEVHANGMTVRNGPGGSRRTEVERADHTRLVADGGGRGYIQHPYSYGGHAYYSRTYYYHGGYYNSYYRGYYYNGYYFNGYMPAYYYPPAYYGWAYNPWPAPVAYGWGWGASPWYGYYGAYFAPYPVYPSAAFWLTDYLVAASLANAYAAVAVGSVRPQDINPARLVYASYDPGTGTTSPTMTKEVKDAISEEIKRELAARKAQGETDATPANLGTLLADGQPHVFVASAALSVPSAGQDCGLTEGDVLALNAPPAQGSSAADLRVLASKQTDCGKGNVVTVELTDLQDMQNNLLANIDKGMKEMKDNPGKGGLPAPPADAVQGTKEAPYTAAAPAADPNGATELDQQAKEGAQVEQQVVTEAQAPEEGAGPGPVSNSPIGGVTTPAPAPHHTGPITIALGQTPAQVIENKGQPTNKVNFPNKTVYIYPDMKITFVNGKVSDVN